MTDRIMLSAEDSSAIQAAGEVFVARVQELIGQNAPEGDGACAFAASVCVQAVIRGAAKQRQDDDDWAKAAMLGAGEGVGAVLGLIPDEGLRRAVYGGCVTAMGNGMSNQAHIHKTEGNA